MREKREYSVIIDLSNESAHERAAILARRRLSLYEQKSEVAHPLRQSNPDGTAARGLMGLSAGHAMHAFITAKLEQIGAIHERLTRVNIRWSLYCKKRLSRVQYNIDVVDCTQKLQVRDAV